MLSQILSNPDVAEALEIIQSEFLLAIWETVYVTLVATLFSVIIGLPLGVLIVAGEENGVLPLPKPVLAVINVVINLLRSVPFLILMILVFPLTRLIVGTVVSIDCREIRKELRRELIIPVDCSVEVPPAKPCLRFIIVVWCCFLVDIIPFVLCVQCIVSTVDTQVDLRAVVEDMGNLGI